MNGRSAENIGVSDEIIENLLRKGIIRALLLWYLSIVNFKSSVIVYCRFEPIRSTNHDCYDVKSFKL